MKLNTQTDDGKIKVSYGIWLLMLIIAFSINTSKTISVLNEAMDALTKSVQNNLYIEIFKISSIFVVLNLIWMVIWYFVSNVLSVITIGKRKITKEMDADSVSYFLIRGILFISIIFSFLPVFETLIRYFIPSFGVPFYH